MAPLQTGPQFSCGLGILEGWTDGRPKARERREKDVTRCRTAAGHSRNLCSTLYQRCSSKPRGDGGSFCRYSMLRTTPVMLHSHCKVPGIVAEFPQGKMPAHKCPVPVARVGEAGVLRTPCALHPGLASKLVQSHDSPNWHLGDPVELSAVGDDGVAVLVFFKLDVAQMQDACNYPQEILEMKTENAAKSSTTQSSHYGKEVALYLCKTLFSSLPPRKVPTSTSLGAKSMTTKAF